MRPRNARRLVLAAVALGLIGARPVASPDELIRRAVSATESGELDEADTLLQQAEEQTPDPGLVAFNRGIIQLRRGNAREAERLFRRTLADLAAPPERRSRGLYNLGNSLVRQAGETDVAILQSAIECYEMVLNETGDDGLRVDAAHNLEVAKLLWAKAKLRRPPGQPEPDWNDPNDPKKQPPGPTAPKEEPGDTTDGKRPEPVQKVEAGKGKDPGIAAKEAPKPVPGQGNLPVVPDTDEVPSLASDDARAVLERTTDRVRRERQRLREEAAQGDRPRAKDW